MSKFAPVPPIDLGNKMSQTMLRAANACLRSAYFYAKTKGLATSVPMQRGSVAHAAFEKIVLLSAEMGEAKIPPHIAKAVLDEVFEEMHVPMEEHDFIREMVFRFAESMEFAPDRLMGVEQLFVLDVEGVQVRAKIDYLAMGEDGRTPLVLDWKTARGAPKADDVSRVRTDGTLGAKSFQLVLYGLMVVFGRPVREEWCGQCHGSGVHRSVHSGTEVCNLCDGHPRREVVEPLSIAPQALGVDMAFVYPAIPAGNGMHRLPMSMTRLELEESMDSLRALVRHVKRAEASGDWPALQSDSACVECALPGECPIPRELRDYRGVVNTPEEAAEAFEKLDREQAEHRARRKELKLFVETLPDQEVRWGKDKASRFVVTETTSIPKRAEMLAQVEAALQGRATFRAEDYVKTRTGTTFKDVTLSADELAAEAADTKEKTDGEQ